MDNIDMSEYEKEAVNNMKLRDKMFEEMDSDTDDEIREIRANTQMKQEERKFLTAKGQNRQSAKRNSFKLRFSSSIPEEYRRRSFRLQNKPPTNFAEDLPIEVFKHSYYLVMGTIE